jgi:two-component system, LytTR family, response regulator
VEPARLERAIRRLRALPLGAPRADAVAPPTQLLIADRGATHVVRCADIQWLQSADNYVTVHLPQRALLMRRTLESLLKDLGPGFVRTHRGAAVALSAVEAVRPRGTGDAVVLVRGGIEVPCSRQHRAAVVQRLQELQR